MVDESVASKLSSHFTVKSIACRAYRVDALPPNLQLEEQRTDCNGSFAERN